MNYFTSALIGCMLVIPVTWSIAAHTKEAPKKEAKNDIVCMTNEEAEKLMTDKGYDILLNMTNNDGVVESVWYGGKSIVITAAVPNEKKSCLLTTMNDVTYNPKAVEEIWETYKKQTKQKDI
jgi:hypothetical protein